MRNLSAVLHIITAPLIFTAWLISIQLSAPIHLAAEEISTTDLNARYVHVVRPILERHCIDCHGTDDAEGDLDLASQRDLSTVVQSFRHWMVVMDRLEASEMPPKDYDSQPTPAERRQVIEWIGAVREVESQRTKGDPGIVLARRLSNAEYNNAIRDLTLQDLQVANEFPVDPANQEGFDNTGESLTMTPSLVQKYVRAARQVAEHLVIVPDGIRFAPHPVITDTDRDKYCVNRIIDFYRRHEVNYADYLFALWKYQHRRKDQEIPPSDLSDVAEQHGISLRYLSLLDQELQPIDSKPNGTSIPQDEIGPIAALRAMWNELLHDTNHRANLDKDERERLARQSCSNMAQFISTVRSQLVPTVENLTTPEVHKGSQPLVLWKNRQFVQNRRRYVSGALELSATGLEQDDAGFRQMQIPQSDTEQSAYEETFHKFCSLFPDTFVVTERARVYLDPKEESQKGRTGRYLSAGFHSQLGYFRDDAPLYDLILDEAEREEIDQLWTELNFVTSAPMRQYANFIWFDRTDSKFMRDSEFDRFRAEDKDCTSEKKVQALAKVYLAKAERVGGNPEALSAIDRYFKEMSATFEDLRRLRQDTEQTQLSAVVAFAQRAFRRPLTAQQSDSIREFYHSLRHSSGLDHEEALRDTLVSVLLSPRFCFRIDCLTEQSSPQRPTKIQALDAYDVASRLSFFLWASIPDDELLALAEKGTLVDPIVLRQQARRMLRDPRSLGFIKEFMGNWLGFRRFEEHQGVDRNRYPEFTDELRQSMFEEPLKLLAHLIRTDGSLLDLIHADYVIVDSGLAKHYGIPFHEEQDDLSTWKRIDNASQYGRGGLLPMAIFLTQNSPGLRTSPVQRGNWLVKRILGEHIPAPPAAVPDLPEDEASLGEMTLRQALERHRADPSCASCHDRIDSFGLVFESYSPIGRRRDSDFGGRAVDDTVVFPDQSERTGITGLREYISEQRERDFVDHFCRKLLAYALGRSLQLSDEPLIESMVGGAYEHDFRITVFFEQVILSQAFLNKRTAL